MHLSLVPKQALILALAALRLVSAETPTDGEIIGHLFPSCDGHRIGGHKIITLPVDRCLRKPGLALEIKTAAVCSNGTRAQLARFTDSKCGHGTLSETFGLIPVADSDIDECMSTGGFGDNERIRSVAFWCDGVEKSSPGGEGKKHKGDENVDKSERGSVSESACTPGKAPTFSHPRTDTCVNLRTHRMQVYSAGVCANGTQATLALYKHVSCGGGPKDFMRITEEDLGKCMDLTNALSFAFYCTGEGIEDSTGSPTGPGTPKQNSGGIMQFLLVLFLIILMFFLMLVMSIYTWIRKYGGSTGKLIQFLQSFLKPKEGGIAI